LANLSEAHVIIELAKKGLYAQRVQGCNFDILCQNGKRVEVKSSRLRKTITTHGERRYEYPAYKFMTNVKTLMSHSHGRAYYAGYAQKTMYCDYTVLVGFDNKDEPERFYVIPQPELGKLTGVSIFLNKQPDKWTKFRDKWEYLL
jgi:hypothetical protein